MSIFFSEGTRLAEGRYVLERRLGAGGMATVWLGRDTRLDRSVAIKLPSEALSNDATFARRFEREAQTAAALSHPHLVSVYDFGNEGERPYLVSEYIDGWNLAELRERDCPPETEALARTLLEALMHIHAAGIVHRDVKPANVLVDRAGRILLTDFGIAQSSEETSLTGTGQVIGTYSYIAPEVRRGARAGPRSDLYACGVVLSEQLSESDPDRVARLVAALTEDDPGARPLNAEQALELLARRSVVVTATVPVEPTLAATEPLVRRDRPSPRPFPTPPAPPEREGSSRLFPIAAAVAALLAAVVAVIVITSGGGGDGGGNGSRAAGADAKGGGGTSTTATKADPSTTETTSTTTPTETTTATTPTTPADDVLAGGTDPARGIALNNEGFALLQQGDVTGALPKLSEAVASFPSDSTEIDYAYALFNYAQALQLSGDPAAAIPLLEKRLSFSDFKVDEVQAELKTAQKAVAGK